MITIEDALIFAAKDHKGQTDLDGKPVILHPLQVGLKGENKEEIITGFLHDVVEDTNQTFEDIKKIGVSENVMYALKLLTKEKGQPYQEYLERIVKSGNELALKVKRNDLLCNLQRNDANTQQKTKIKKKHNEAYKLISRTLEKNSTLKS